MYLGFKGPAFTWSRYINDGKKISKRLDRTLMDCDWRTTFPEASCMHLHRLYSDHNPFLVRLHSLSPHLGPAPYVLKPLGCPILSFMMWWRKLGVIQKAVLLIAWTRLGRPLFPSIKRSLTIFQWKKNIANKLNGIQRAYGEGGLCEVD